MTITYSSGRPASYICGCNFSRLLVVLGRRGRELSQAQVLAKRVPSPPSPSESYPVSRTKTTPPLSTPFHRTTITITITITPSCSFYSFIFSHASGSAMDLLKNISVGLTADKLRLLSDKHLSPTVVESAFSGLTPPSGHSI